MRANTFKPICVVFAAMLSAAASAAPSGMYRWVDETGAVTYSDHAPPENARDVTLIDDSSNTISSSEKRTREILELERQGNPLATREPASGSAVTESAPSATANGDTPASPRAGISPMQPEAVRDPCLRSADPKCYERNRANYVPGRGYTPDGASVTAVGATSSSGAGGTLAGSVPPPPPKLIAPKSSAYALPPGSDKGAAPLPPLSSVKR